MAYPVVKEHERNLQSNGYSKAYWSQAQECCHLCAGSLLLQEGKQVGMEDISFVDVAAEDEDLNTQENIFHEI